MLAHSSSNTASGTPADDTAVAGQQAYLSSSSNDLGAEFNSKLYDEIL
jgi:hypothetical protein